MADELLVDSVVENAALAEVGNSFDENTITVLRTPWPRAGLTAAHEETDQQPKQAAGVSARQLTKPVDSDDRFMDVSRSIRKYPNVHS